MAVFSPFDLSQESSSLSPGFSGIPFCSMCANDHATRSARTASKSNPGPKCSVIRRRVTARLAPMWPYMTSSVISYPCRLPASTQPRMFRDSVSNIRPSISKITAETNRLSPPFRLKVRIEGTKEGARKVRALSLTS